MRELVLTIRKATDEEFKIYYKYLCNHRQQQGVIKDTTYTVLYERHDGKTRKFTVHKLCSLENIITQIKKDSGEI